MRDLDDSDPGIVMTRQGPSTEVEDSSEEQSAEQSSSESSPEPLPDAPSSRTRSHGASLDQTVFNNDNLKGLIGYCNEVLNSAHFIEAVLFADVHVERNSKVCSSMPASESQRTVAR